MIPIETVNTTMPRFPEFLRVNGYDDRQVEEYMKTLGKYIAMPAWQLPYTDEEITWAARKFYRQLGWTSATPLWEAFNAFALFLEVCAPPAGGVPETYEPEFVRASTLTRR